MAVPRTDGGTARRIVRPSGSAAWGRAACAFGTMRAARRMASHHLDPSGPFGRYRQGMAPDHLGAAPARAQRDDVLAQDQRDDVLAQMEARIAELDLVSAFAPGQQYALWEHGHVVVRTA